MSSENTEPVRRRSHRTASTADQAAAAKRMTTTADASGVAASPAAPRQGGRTRSQQSRNRTGGSTRRAGGSPLAATDRRAPGATESPAEVGQPAAATPAATVVDPVVVDVKLAEAVVMAGDAATAEVLDAKLLAHLDEVLAEVPAGALTIPDEPAPARPEVDAGRSEAREAGRSEAAPLWSQVLTDPGFAAEHVARDLVRRLGPAAQEWVERTRQRYPEARRDALALLALAEHRRTARRMALGAALPSRLVPLVAAGVDISLLGRAQASLVLTIAAVYGADPTAPERAEDLLAVLPLPRLTQRGSAAARNAGRLLAAVALRRVAGRVAPFGATVASIVHSELSMEAVARRAITRLRVTAN